MEAKPPETCNRDYTKTVVLKALESYLAQIITVGSAVIQRA